MPNAFSINLNSLTIKITYIGPTDEIPNDYLYAMPGDKGWKVYDDENELVGGLVERVVVERLDKMFHPETIMPKDERHYFKLEEHEDE